MAIEDLETSLGLTFKDQGLLRQALVHRSYLNEHGGSSLDSYERMEFLGDAVLELIVSTELYSNLPHITEGELTKGRSSLVCRPSLARAARRLSIGRHLALGKGEVESGGHNRESILEEAYESVVAAIYLDQGYDAARDFVLRSLEPDLEEIFRRGRPVENPKSRLQELIQGIGLPTPRYELVSAEGPDHQPVFTVQVLVDDEILGQGTGSKKADAERAAAQMALDRQPTLDARLSRATRLTGAGTEAGALNVAQAQYRNQQPGSNANDIQCSHSFNETGKITGKKPTKASSGAGSAGSGAFLTFSAPLIWMKRFGKSLKKS
ncbi:MAG: ribonuclease III [Chloroflexota bacterium]|nr:ribonuclease III [Chloroflexota bacterium]